MDDIKPKALEEKLKSQLSLLEFEHAVFERMVYKNKNQHRRCSYFQYLLKVRRELRLLRTANMVEILRPCFCVISGKGSKLQVLESLKLKKSDTGKPNILERLLGALRLLSQMTEPILNAASGISTLLACSFFIPSSLTFLALLARLRVLIQQILVDAVSVFNSVASTSLKKQSVKIAEDRVEVFREFYPKEKECITLLECVWKTDKYVLLETLQNNESSKPIEDNVSEDAATRGSLVQYQTSVSSLGEDLSPVIEADNGGVTVRESSTPVAEAASSVTNDALQPEASENAEDATIRGCSIQYQTSISPLGEDPSPLLEAERNDGVTATASSTLIAEADPSKTNDGSQIEDTDKPEDESSNPVTVIPAKTNTDKIKPSFRATKVAFLPLKRHSSAITPNAIEEPPRKKHETGEKDKKEEDGFYNLLIRGTHKDSLF
ncbi:unnamed protein product [Microthlaspi erraticum]|uniref:Nucleolus and neural progenitor protein-like N-terminal domain-containing protein n=1 Tax=Microthlaspi erraticum TaxID=1685480 RepID=A0A6D2KJM9_9BRAS|nr:unnamed protein product [Microthlaspi erraticum]